MCRWAQLFVALSMFQSDYTSVVVLLILLCVDERFLAALGNSDEATKRSSAEEIKALRAACKSAVAFSLHVLVSPLNRRKALIMAVLPREVRHWFEDQQRELVSFAKNAAWLRTQVVGGFWKPLQSTWAIASSPRILEELGFCIDFPSRLANLEEFELRRGEDEQTGKHVGKFLQSLAKRRIFRAAWQLYGWNTRFAWFL